MYIDLIVLFILILLMALIFRRVSNTILFLGDIDVTMRIIHWIGDNTTKSINSFINKYVPTSIPGIISRYSNGIVETILIWGYIILMIMFVYYVFRILLHRS